MTSLSPAWHIGLSAWIIQDGNYNDFEVGQTADFAVEVYAEKGFTVLADVEPPISAVHRGDGIYDLVGKIVYRSSKVWVADFGILVYREEALPKGFEIGAMITGRAYLGVDPFFYFEYLNREVGIPALIYRWHISNIGMETAPFIEQDSSKALVRDKSKSNFIPIQRTDAWKDDGGHGDYTLVCERTEGAPFRSRDPENQ